jgi:hypothetical protein
MKLAWQRLAALGAVVLGGLLVGPAASGQDDLYTKDNAITGTMEIEFKTRTDLDEEGNFVDGSPAKGAKDIYKLSLTVAETTVYSGTVSRQPELLSRILRKQEQKPQLEYNITLSVRNPRKLEEKKTVGKWVGTVPMNPANGLYDLAGGAKSAESPLRIATDAIGTTQASNDKFGGKMYGKSKKESAFTAYTYKRLIGEKTVEIKVAKVDPMRFDDLELARGPTANYPHTTVNGRLDYDYETGNWLTDGLKFRYTLNGKDVEDVMTGSIKWVEDENRKSNGKGFYDFNLRFNESKNKTATTESDAFAKLSDEEAFFAVDDSIPCLTGKVSYVDQFVSGTTSPARSKVTYELNANKLTKTQLVNFFKLWMVGVGPINDE